MRNHLLLSAALPAALLASSPRDARAQPLSLDARPAFEGLRTDHPSPQPLEETPRTALGDLAARIRIPYVATVSPLRQAISRAHEWLGEPACREVFSDFEDQSGKLLSDVLAEREVTAQGHLRRLLYYDGSRYPQCHVKGIAALTAPGNYAIFVCPAEFQRVSRDPRKAAATIVHELLHSLGLGENPPSSREITARVLERCSG